MKRISSSVYSNTRSKKPRLVEPLNTSTKENFLVSASSIYNYMIGDSLVDWLKINSKKSNNLKFLNNREDNFSNFILAKGNQFEDNLVKYINDNIYQVVKVSNIINKDTCEKTIKLMENGIPIIHSAPFINKNNGTKGIIDILIRSDYINNLTEIPSLKSEDIFNEGKKLGNNYHYVVVDIKFSTLPLRTDGIHIQNSDQFSAYKGQLYIYNQAIGSIQGYTPPYAFILGRRVKFTEKSIIYTEYDCLNRLGKIDYSSLDKKYIKTTKEAINWVRNVNKNAKTWSVNPPSNFNLYPNMCKDSGKWNKDKQKIANDIGEITSIWNIGKKHRDIALKKGINSWKNKNCTTKNIGINGKRASTIDKILIVNRENKCKMSPKVIKNNQYNWKYNKNEIYVDFETISDIFTDFTELPKQYPSDMIFMIGLGYVNNNKWTYKNFICKEATYEEEYRIMNEFITFIKEEKDEPVLNFWCAEEKFWNKAESRQFDLAHKNNDNERKDNISDNWKINSWCNLYDIFIQEPIIIKNSFNFGLKSIAKAMYGHNMIKTHIESSCNSGMTAMINANNCYKNEKTPDECNIMQDISKYNEFDCKVLWEIIQYLRKNHI
jgi:uncharacterized protein